ncbi:MAG: HAD family hydrolase, partial [Acetanaerobacterium sp.]
ARRFALRESPDMLLHETHIMIAEKYRTVIQPRLGALAYLRKLKDANVAMCVATLTDREFVLDALAHYGMIELFEFVLTVGEVGKSKEEPDIYLECARRLGANPSNTVVFEDSLYAIRTAKRAGFTVYAVRDEVALPDQNEIKALCNRYIEDFSELL